MPLSPPTTVLLDLDGTLVDPAVGILRCCREALADLDCQVAPSEDLRWVIGPPLRETMAVLLGGRADPEAAVRLYRARYGVQGLYEATVYDGVPQALSALQARGHRLLVCTSKAQVFAARIIEHFGLGAHVSGVYGPDLDGRYEDKGDLIAHILEAESLAPGAACMVGDRKHDIRAAVRHGIPGIGVLWGYGGEAELREAGAAMLIAQPADLPVACETVGLRRA